MSVLDELGTYLQALGYGTRGTTIFEGRVPTAPDAVIVLQEYPGRPGEYFFGEAGERIHRPRVQVLVRSGIAAGDYATARALAETIYQKLSEGASLTLSGVRYLALTPQQPVFKLDEDTNGRTRFVFNVEAEREQP